jgi:branched-chain amino acid transport system permease protein
MARAMAALSAVMAALAVLVSTTANGFWLSTLTSALCLALASRGIGVLFGRLGLVSLCQFALVGIGGWVALRLRIGYGIPFEGALLAGGAVSTVVAVAWGLPALRFRGIHLALVTLMLAGAFQIFISATGFPDGGTGFLGKVHGTGRILMSRPWLATSDAAYFLYVDAVVTVCFLFVELHVRSFPGRTWALIQKDERVAQAAGIEIVRYKLWAFALAGFCAGVSGGLLAGAVGQLDGRAFGASESILLFALSIVGGVHGWGGALVTGGLMRAAPALLNDIGVDGFVATALFGIALLHAFTTSPRRLAQTLAQVGPGLWRAMRGLGR